MLISYTGTNISDSLQHISAQRLNHENGAPYDILSYFPEACIEAIFWTAIPEQLFY
jgi:hypothetical protein